MFSVIGNKDRLKILSSPAGRRNPMISIAGLDNNTSVSHRPQSFAVASADDAVKRSIRPRSISPVERHVPNLIPSGGAFVVILRGQRTGRVSATHQGGR